MFQAPFCRVMIRHCTGWHFNFNYEIVLTWLVWWLRHAAFLPKSMNYSWVFIQPWDPDLHQKPGGFAREALGGCAPWWLRWILRDSQDQVWKLRSWVTVYDCAWLWVTVTIQQRKYHKNGILILETKNKYKTVQNMVGSLAKHTKNWRISNLCRPTPDCPHLWESLTVYPWHRWKEVRCRSLHRLRGDTNLPGLGVDFGWRKIQKTHQSILKVKVEELQLWTYGSWKKSCTSWYGKYPIIYRVLCIPSGAGFLSSTVWSPIVRLSYHSRISKGPWLRPRAIVDIKAAFFPFVGYTRFCVRERGYLSTWWLCSKVPL